MHVEGFFEWLGQALGAVIRFVVDALSGLFNLLANAGGNFIDGLARTLGMDTSLVSILMLVIGLLLLYSAVRAFMRASIIMGIIWLMLGLWVLSWVVLDPRWGLTSAPESPCHPGSRPPPASWAGTSTPPAPAARGRCPA